MDLFLFLVEFVTMKSVQVIYLITPTYFTRKSKHTFLLKANFFLLRYPTTDKRQGNC